MSKSERLRENRARSALVACAIRARIYRAFSESATAVASSRDRRRTYRESDTRTQHNTRSSVPRDARQRMLNEIRSRLSCTATCSESVRSRGDTLNIIDTSVCNDNARADDDNDNDEEYELNREPKREIGRSFVVGLTMIDSRDTLCRIDRICLSDEQSAQGIARGIIPLTVALNIAPRELAIISVFAAVAQLRSACLSVASDIERISRPSTEMRG